MPKRINYYMAEKYFLPIDPDEEYRSSGDSGEEQWRQEAAERIAAKILASIPPRDPSQPYQAPDYEAIIAEAENMLGEAQWGKVVPVADEDDKP